MYRALFQKELAHRLLDLRFATVCLLCCVLAGLGVFFGVQQYELQVSEYDGLAQRQRQTFDDWVSHRNFRALVEAGISWYDRPEVLSPLVTGISHQVGRRAFLARRSRGLAHMPLPHLELSAAEADPAFMLFGLLDLSTVVLFVLSLAVLLFTHDVVCGEKESGTLRLICSFPVPRWRHAAAKLTGSLSAVLIPFILSFLIAVLILVLSPGIALTFNDLSRIATLGALYILYLAAFAAFGLWVSSLSTRRVTSFLILLSLWAAWVFLIPELSVYVGRKLSPVNSFRDIERENSRLRWQVVAPGARKERDEHFRSAYPGQDIDDGAFSWNHRFDPANLQSDEKWSRLHLNQVQALLGERANRKLRQFETIVVLGALSPVGAMTLAATDLARTGWRQYHLTEQAYRNYHRYYIEYTRSRETIHGTRSQLDITDFALFREPEDEGIRTVLVRNLFPILNLMLFVVLGFIGGFVALLRYDVR